MWNPEEDVRIAVGPSLLALPPCSGAAHLPCLSFISGRVVGDLRLQKGSRGASVSVFSLPLFCLDQLIAVFCDDTQTNWVQTHCSRSTCGDGHHRHLLQLQESFPQNIV